MNKVLINISNSPSSTWPTKQKKGWKEIIDVEFPNLKPDLDVNDDEYKKIEGELKQKIYIIEKDIIMKYGAITNIYIYLEGKSSLCYRLFEQLGYDFRFCVPVYKTNLEFIKWRDIKFNLI